MHFKYRPVLNITMGTIISSLSPAFQLVSFSHTIRRPLPIITLCDINGTRSFSTKQTETTVGSEVSEKEIYVHRLPK